MRKRKTSDAPPGKSLLKLHLSLYVIATILLSYNVFVTLGYRGNADVPFAVFRPFIEQHLAVIMFWGLAVVGHVAVYQFRKLGYNRAQRQQINRPYTDAYERLADDDAVEKDIFYDDEPQFNTANR